MSLLSDRQIKKLCTPPTFMVTERINEARVITGGVSYDIFMLPTQKEYLTNITEQELLAKPKSDSTSVCGVVSYRSATEEEITAYVPMISDFSPVQVRVKTESLKDFIKRIDTLISTLPSDHEQSGLNPLEVCFDGDVIIDGKKVELNEDKIISYGLSSFGYDFRVADEFKIFTNINSVLIDPLNFDEKSFVNHKGPYCIIPPNSFVLARTMERFCMPNNVAGVCTGKSTIARSGISIMVTPLEPGWEGYLTLEFANVTPLPVKLYAGMGGGQIMFYEGEIPEVTYRDRDGKYMNQAAEVVTPRL